MRVLREKAKTGRSVDEEVAIKARTEAESLPDRLEVYRGRENQVTWLAQVLAMLPLKLYNAIHEAIAKSQLQPVWGDIEAADLALCETQDRRLYGLVLGFPSSKDVEGSSRYDANQLFARIHNNRSDVAESGCAAPAYFPRLAGGNAEMEGTTARTAIMNLDVKATSYTELLQTILPFSDLACKLGKRFKPFWAIVAGR